MQFELRFADQPPTDVVRRSAGNLQVLVLASWSESNGRSSSIHENVSNNARAIVGLSTFSFPALGIVTIINKLA